MNKQLENIKQCTTCFSTHLEYLPLFEHEDIELNTIDETIMRVDDVVKCVDCDTLYYLENNYITKEYSFNADPFKDKKLNYVSDYEVAISKM